MAFNSSAVSADNGGHNRATAKHLTMTVASRALHSSSSSPPLPHAPSLTHQINRLEEINNSEPTIPVQMNDKDCDSDDELSVSSAPRHLSSRFRQPPLIRNASDLGPRVLGHQMALIEQNCRAADLDQDRSDDHRLKPVNNISEQGGNDHVTHFDAVSESCDNPAIDGPSFVSVSVNHRNENHGRSS
jgi:hypothetical protein